MKDEGSNTEPSASENPVKRWLVRNKVYISWGVLALLVGYVGVASILAFAGQKLPMVTFFTVEVLDNQAKGAIVTAAVSWVAGIAALFTFFLNRDQKEKHLQKQLEQDAKQAELQRLEKLFGDLAEDFASHVVLNRINAAIGLSEIAQTPDPRCNSLEKTNGKNTLSNRDYLNFELYQLKAIIDRTQISAPDQLKSEAQEKTKDEYPYFLRAADRLAAALHQWGEQPARDEVRKAIRQLAYFAKAEGTEELLLHDLCNALADANRTALGIFVETMAEGLSAGRPTLTELAQLCQFLDDPTETESCLNQLCESPEGTAALCRWKSLRRAIDDVTTAGLATDFYLRFARASQALLDARDALADALKILSPPSDLPVLTTDWQLGERSVLLMDTLRTLIERNLNLTGTFLAGTNLFNANLQGVRLDRALCQRTSFSCAQVQGASFTEAKLHGANLESAVGHGVSLTKAQLQNARLVNAHLQAAFFDSACLGGANLQNAKLERASFSRAELHGADLRGAELKDAGLARAECGQNGGTPAVFSPGGWVNAEFRTAIVIENGVVTMYGEEDTKLKDWLMATYPPDTPPSPRNPLI